MRVNRDDEANTNDNAYAMAGLDKSVRVKVISPKEAIDQAEAELLR